MKSHVRWYGIGLLAALVTPLQPVAGQQARNAGYDEALFAGMTYRNVGPSRGGRVTAVAGHRDQRATFYMGATGGGIWKTTDYGHSWRPVSDGFFATGSIGSIDVADADPDIVYVGTGSDGIRSNVIGGRGVYKSNDAGRTWEFIGLPNAGQIGAVIVHPRNPDVALVAAIGHAFAPNPDRGVYRTTDGGASWEHVLYLSDSTGAVDLEFAPDNPQEIYAAMWRAERKPWSIISGAYEGGMYKSTDGGTTWRQLTTGLPSGLRGKADLAVSAADPDRVYVLMEAPVGEGGLYRSDDRGETWELVTTQPNLLDRPFYYTNLDADPTNADVLYVNSTGYFKSVDAGRTWERGSTPHGDNHDMWINPDDSNIFIQSNDGGANVTLDGGKSWSTQNNQPTGELYQVDIDDQFPYWLYAGQQDNSTIMAPSRPPYGTAVGPSAYWRPIGGCETGPAVPQPGNHNIVYSNCKGRFGRFSKETGQEKQYYVGAANIYGHDPNDLAYRFQRVSPIEVSPHDPGIVYHGSQFLHRTTDEGVTWETISPDLTAFTPETQVISGSPITRDVTGEEYYSTLYAIEESPLEPGVIWVGSNDGPIHVTRDHGLNWTDVTPAGLPKGGRVQTIDPSPHSPGKAYAAVYRYLLGDWQPYIYRTEDYGASWTRLTTGSNGIPADYPTRVVREDPAREGLLYAGTEFGMFISFDDGANWQSFQQNLPVTPITDIKLYRGDLVMSTMGRAFWIMYDIGPMAQLTDRVAGSPAHLFVPSDAYRMRYRSGGFRGRDPGEPDYAPAGANIHYYLAAAASDVSLEILDARGNLIRGFSNSGPGEDWVVPEEPGMREFRLERMGTPRLDAGAGMHRFVWDMAHAGAWDSDVRRAGQGGPIVVPGQYQARLTVDGRIFTESFLVRMDPRVQSDGVTTADIADQVELVLHIRDALSEAKVASIQVERLSDANNLGDDLRARLERLTRTLETEDGRYMTPMLVEQLEYLYSMLNRADQEPGQDGYMRYTQLRETLDGVVDELRRIMSSIADR